MVLGSPFLHARWVIVRSVCCVPGLRYVYCIRVCGIYPHDVTLILRFVDVVTMTLLFCSVVIYGDLIVVVPITVVTTFDVDNSTPLRWS